MTLLFLKEKPEKVKGYLRFGVIVIKVIVGAVVGVVGFVQQFYCQRPAERLGHKRMLQDSHERARVVLI